MNTINMLKLPRKVYSGEKALENLGQILADYSQVAIITDRGIMQAGLFDQVKKYIDSIEIHSQVYDDIPPEPSYSQVQSIIDSLKKNNVDIILALGGGSVMDTAKLASICMSNDCSVHDLLSTPLLGKKTIPTIMIPTTAGTGSEATPNGIVAVPEKEIKVGIVNDEMIPDYVFLDPSMIKSLPEKIAAATGIDALAHAIECFTGNKANTFSDFFALESLDLIFNNLLEACKNKDAVDAKAKMQIASFYAGVSITCSGTTAVHALSYPLGGKFHIAHGVSNAILLVPVMKFNEKACKSRFSQIYDRVNHENKDKNLSIDEKSEWVLAKLEGFIKELQIPSSLKEFGVKEEHIDDLVKDAYGVKRLLDNNVIALSTDDIKSIYLQIF